MATLTNDDTLQSAQPTASWGAVSHLSLHKVATGGTAYIGFTALDTSRTPAIGQRIQFAAGAIDVVINDQGTGGEFGAYGAQQALGGLKAAGGDGNFYVGLHTGAPGTGGTANEVSGGGYARISEAAADWTVS